jgi:4-hydroxyphenylpyruvate dioxygenase-like putative hemolysin
MAQTILLFRINRDKYAVIQNVCRTLGIRIIDVARKDYSQKLGTLAQIQGFSKEAKKYDGPELPAEMLVFSEMNSDQVDAFLAEYKKTGVEPIALKAVVTDQNIFWTADRMQKELLREHLFMSNTNKSNM